MKLVIICGKCFNSETNFELLFVILKYNYIDRCLYIKKYIKYSTKVLKNNQWKFLQFFYFFIKHSDETGV